MSEESKQPGKFVVQQIPEVVALGEGSLWDVDLGRHAQVVGDSPDTQRLAVVADHNVPMLSNTVPLPGWQGMPSSSVQVLLPDTREPAIVISPEGMVTLNPRLNLDMVKDMPLWMLQAMREVIDVAIRDHEAK